MIATIVISNLYIDLRIPSLIDALSQLLRTSLSKSLIDIISIIVNIIFINFSLEYIMLNKVTIYEKSKTANSFAELLDEYQDLFID